MIEIVPSQDPNEENYAHCQVTALMPIEADRFFDWYMDEPIENFMRGTTFVAPIIGTALLSGTTYRNAGDQRRIHFKDGTVASELILSTDFPRSYSYQPYAYDNPIRLFSDYAKSTMAAVSEGPQTKIVWDYAFHARNKAALQVVKLFVALDWKRNLQNALAVIEKHLAEHGPSKHIHETAVRAA